MFTALWLRAVPRQRQKPRRPRRGQPVRLHLEPLENRCLLSFSPGPLVEVSNPDPLAGCPAPFLGADVAGEPSIAVNPTKPKNIVADWIDHGAAGLAAAVTFDGGKTWQNLAIPGITQCTGGTEPTAFDPWLSFAPDGSLYSIGITGGLGTGSPLLVSKSTDGGLTWSSPTRINTLQDKTDRDDKPSITADPTNPNYVYATWARSNASGFNENNAETMFARSIDGGQTWQTEKDIHDAPGSDFNLGHQIVVLPDGTLIDAFTEGGINGSHQVVLTLLRSTDHGQTWSGPIQAVVQEPLVVPNSNPPNGLVTDPNTGQGVEAHPMFDSFAVDPNTGNLYAVWIDGRFSNFQYNSIDLSMSADGGFTWSNPVQVNQTPNTVPPIDRQAWNPTVAVAADGTVAVSYYDFRNNTGNGGALTDYWMAFCHPSATAPATNPANWGEVRLTNTSFNLEQAPPRMFGDFWVGDYEGLKAVGNDFVAVWGMPDGSATSQESIFFRREFSTGGSFASALKRDSAAPGAAAGGGARSRAGAATAQPHELRLGPGVSGAMLTPTSARGSPAPAASHGQPPTEGTSAHKSVAASSQAAAAVTPAAALDHLPAQRRAGQLFDGLAEDLDATGLS